MFLFLSACILTHAEPATCDALEAEMAAESFAIRSCSADEECGQPLVGTSCGCTRDLVAREDADPTRFYELMDEMAAAECGGFESTCDCPAADGFACDEGVCSWDYVDSTTLPACRADEGAASWLRSASIDGDTLLATLGMSGGCGEHDFALCWPDGTFLESEPVQVSLEILHTSDDPCEALLTEVAELDLTPLKTAWQRAYSRESGTIVIHLPDESLVYSF